MLLILSIPDQILVWYFELNCWWNWSWEKSSHHFKVLYSLPLKTFTLVADSKNNIYLAQTLGFDINNVDFKSKEFANASIEESAQNKNSILKSYDFFLNTKYDVVVNDSAVDRVKNYFK